MVSSSCSHRFLGAHGAPKFLCVRRRNARMRKTVCGPLPTPPPFPPPPPPPLLQLTSNLGTDVWRNLAPETPTSDPVVEEQVRAVLIVHIMGF